MLIGWLKHFQGPTSSRQSNLHGCLIIHHVGAPSFSRHRLHRPATTLVSALRKTLQFNGGALRKPCEPLAGMCARQCRVTSPKFDPPPAIARASKQTNSQSYHNQDWIPLLQSARYTTVPRDGFPVSCLLFVLLKDVASGYRTGNNSVAVVLGYRERERGRNPGRQGRP